MNPYLRNLQKIEFVVTNACTGRCKHCSEGERTACVQEIDPSLASDAVKRVCAHYAIKTVMAFGGEPLLHQTAVYAVMNAAREAGVAHRQVITNGFFTQDETQMRACASMLFSCGVNDLLLSVDAFHQESIPIDTVKAFARALKENGIPTRLQAAWLVSAEDDNPYNRETRKLLEGFADMEIPVGAGNVIFCEGNAKKYLADYFKNASPENPYREDACDVRCLSFAANGDVLDGNVYQTDILEILRAYRMKEARA